MRAVIFFHTVKGYWLWNLTAYCVWVCVPCVNISAGLLFLKNNPAASPALLLPLGCLLTLSELLFLNLTDLHLTLPEVQTLGCLARVWHGLTVMIGKLGNIDVYNILSRYLCAFVCVSLCSNVKKQQKRNKTWLHPSPVVSCNSNLTQINHVNTTVLAKISTVLTDSGTFTWAHMR